MRLGNPKRRLLAAEVVQTSTMDCGPAALASLLEGFGIRVSYGRLREACQTDIDGTSIDTLEEVANQLGLKAEQVMVPVDHLLVPQAQCLPAIVVIHLPNGATHFVVVWRQYGDFVELMDPGVGRRWVRTRELLTSLFQHSMPVPAADWRDWAGTPEFIEPLRARLAGLGLSRGRAKTLIAAAEEDPGWRGLAVLDAATRLVTSLVRSGGLKRGNAAERLLSLLIERDQSGEAAAEEGIPANFWLVRATAQPGDDGDELVLLRGAVMVRVLGRRTTRAASELVPQAEEADAATPASPLSPELVAALEERPARPVRKLLGLLRADGLTTPAVVICALVLAALGVMVQAIVFRGFFEVGADLALFGSKLGYLGLIVALLVALAVLELPLRSGLFRMGRHLEVRLRQAFLAKIPRLGDRYFQSRLSSDMAERSHALHLMRGLPILAGSFLQALFGLVFTTAGLIWLDPGSMPFAVTAACAAVFLPMILQKPLAQRDMRFRTHNGALTRFYLDALLGLVPARTHGAEPALRCDHEGLLVDWSQAGLSAQRAVVVVEGLLALSGFGFAALLLFAHLEREGQGGTVLLLIYWALSLPVLGQSLAMAARQYPSLRNITLRMLEPLGAPESEAPEMTVGEPDPARGTPAKVSLEGVTVVAGGHTILSDVDLEVPAGQHVAIVGASGAGKSSLVGLLLGWHRASQGEVRVDGELLEGRVLDRLRRATAWVDPGVQLWNRSLYANLLYGSQNGPAQALSRVIEEADLRRLLEGMPEGLQTTLGESGALVSGGEGQRIRLARALARGGTRLVILDEPFRGVDRDRRQVLLERARAWWSDATMLYITHDVGQTFGFDRVLVIEDGRVAEDGPPAALMAREGSRLRALVESEEAVRTGLWAGSHWRRLRLEGGLLEERTVGAEPTSSPVEAASQTRRDSGPAATPAVPSTSDVLPSSHLSPEIGRAAWPISGLNQAIEVLVRESGLPHSPAELPTPPPKLGHPAASGLGAWMAGAAQRLGLEAEQVDAGYGEVESLARGAGPAILVVSDGDERRALAVLRSRRGRVRLIGPDLRTHDVPLEEVRDALCAFADAHYGPVADALVEKIGIVRRRRARVRRALLREQLGAVRVGGCFLLRIPPEASFWRQLRDEGLTRYLGLLLGSHATKYVLFVLSWWLIGRGALSGTLDVGWLTGWALLLLTMIPLQMLGSWSQGRFAIGSGALMKRRLLQGALRLAPEEVRKDGSGQHLGRVLESEALESLALSGGFSALTASIEVLLVASILALGAGGALHVGLFAGWVGLSVVSTLHYARRRKGWTQTRLTMTNDLVERMVGHRTRLAQQEPGRWHDGEDEALEGYLLASKDMDRVQVWLSAVVARGWVVAGLLGLSIPFVTGSASTAALAIGIGGILAADQALSKLVSSITSLCGAAIAWNEVAPLYHAATRDDDRPALEAVAEERPQPQPGAPLFEGDDLVFNYPGRPEPVLKGCRVRINQGDRLLLEGPSGGGKSTLASLLIGLRQPTSGLLLLHGLDHRTLGAWRWRQHVTAAPQFHENHVFMETFAFNLLMGRGWPPEPGDLELAERLCRRLGLGPLLERMPAGMMQMIGETGWQLSHGERSRLFLARALLERADLIVLDESFAALDPVNLERSLTCVLEEAPTVLVIAHP
jgi:ABC-type bacteriocin/lantibiotic exporter with double-glycine peptidase domain